MSACPPITFVFAYFKGFLLYESYVIYSLPGVVICAATGLSVGASFAQRVLGGKVVVSAAASFIVIGYFLYTNPFRQWILQHPLEQFRESVILCRGTLDPSRVGQKTCERPVSAFRPTFMTLTWNDWIRSAHSSRRYDAPTKIACLCFSTSACRGLQASIVHKCGPSSPTANSLRSLCACVDSSLVSTGSSGNISPIAPKALISHLTGTKIASEPSQFAENCLPWPDGSFELIQFSISCLWAGQRGARLKDEREKS